MLKEFKEFAFKGNMIDMAVGIILGGAFGLVVKSLVDNILMPLIGGIFKLPDFSQMYHAMDGKTYENLAKAQEATSVVAYGTFINNVINPAITEIAVLTSIANTTNATVIINIMNSILFVSSLPTRQARRNDRPDIPLKQN